MGSIRERLQRKYESFKVSQAEKQRQEAELKKKEQAAYREAYAKSRVASAKRRGTRAGRSKGGVGGTLQRLGSGFTGTYEAMYPEYAPKRRSTRKSTKRSSTTIRVNGTTITVKKGHKKSHTKKKKKDPYDLF